MSLLAIAYSQEDLSAAQRIAAAVEPEVELEHYPVGRANDGELLVHILRKNRLPVILLVSDSLLTNPNAMQGIIGLLERGDQLLPVVIDAHRPDDATGEIVTVQTSLYDRSDIMHYLSHWQDRYIELRRAGDDYTDAISQHAFKAYLRRIRETSVEAEEALERLVELDPLPDAQLVSDEYGYLYELAGVPPPTPTENIQLETPEQTALPQKVGATSAGEAQLDTPSPEPHTDPVLPDERAASESPNDMEEPEADAPNPVTSRAAEEIIHRAWRMSDAGNTEEALEELREGMEDDPDDVALHYEYALMLALAADDIHRAKKEVTSLLSVSPNYPPALFLAGELALASGDHSGARQHWQRLADLQPAYPEVNQRLGFLLTDHFPQDHREAEIYLSRAAKADDANGETYYRYGELLAGPLNRPDKAAKYLQKAVQAEPENAPAHYRLAVLEFDRGRLQHARKNFLLAVNLESAYDTPDNRRAFRTGQASARNQNTPPVATDALTALKQNIADLEAMLSSKENQAPDPTALPGHGKTVFLTGATSGIGLATAHALARDGFRLILAARRAERLHELAGELRDTDGCEVQVLPLDVSERERVGGLLSELPEAWQTIDILINNAGKAKGFDPIHTGDLDHWDEMIDVNLRGLLYVTRAITPGMVARGKGMVINVASTAGKEVYPNGNVYCATKHAVDALTHAMRLDLVKHGIRVGQICPAHVEETEFAVVRFDGDRDRAKIYEDFQPLRASDVAETIRFMVNQPPHVNILDVVLQGTQQASSTVVDRSGRGRYTTEEE